MSNQSGAVSSILGMLRIIGALAVLAIAVVGILVVLEVLPTTMLAEFAMKVFLVAAIAGAAAGLMTVLASGGHH